MNNNNLLLGGIFMALIFCGAIGFYLAFSKEIVPTPITIVSSTPNQITTTANQPCQTIWIAPKAKWTCGIPRYTNCPDLGISNPSVKISDDGNTCTLKVPSQAAAGVAAIDPNVKIFKIEKGDRINISVQGKIKFSNDHPCVDGEGMPGYEDETMDSPFKANVGGLEFSIGSLYDNRYFAGNHYTGIAEFSGVPVFRIIESTNGYSDNNSGAFTVTIKKSK